MDHDRFSALVRRVAGGETVTADELAGVERDPFAAGVLGLVFDTVALDRLTAHLDVRPDHLQPYGIVHGGVWCAVIETMASFGAALHAAQHGKLVVGVSNATDFLRAQRGGRVAIEATPLHTGRSQQLWQAVIRRSEDDQPVARGQVRLQVIDPDQVTGSERGRR